MAWYHFFMSDTDADSATLSICWKQSEIYMCKYVLNLFIYAKIIIYKYIDKKLFSLSKLSKTRQYSHYCNKNVTIDFLFIRLL